MAVYNQGIRLINYSIMLILAVIISCSFILTSFAKNEYRDLQKVQQIFPEHTYAYGVDVSRYQGKVHWPQIREQIDFVFIKATEGSQTVDTYFSYNWSQAKRHGIVRGAYHFFHGHISGKTQAQHFLKTVGKLDDKDLPLVVDVENARTVRFVSAKRYIQQLEIFINNIKDKTGDDPIIYTNYYFWQSFLRNTHAFSSYDLWVANYAKDTAPILPKPWHSWLFWQISSKAKITGIQSPVDLNLFNGNLNSLKEYSAK